MESAFLTLESLMRRSPSESEIGLPRLRKDTR
jgi:hypothetical protein